MGRFKPTLNHKKVTMAELRADSKHGAFLSMRARFMEVGVDLSGSDAACTICFVHKARYESVLYAYNVYFSLI